MSEVERRDISFPSGDTTCQAWHFRSGIQQAPCVVMGHGFGLTRDCSLERYALRFAEAGLDTLIFDYRHFGESGGEPRQLFAIGQQLQDWAAALAAARQLDGVDPNRIAAWGTSFGGGHALVAGVRDRQVAAIVAQCPMMDGLAAFIGAVRYAGLGAATRMTGHALLDLTAGLLGKQGSRLPIVAEPGQLAFMSTPDAAPGFAAITTDDFINEVSARTALAVPLYRPVSIASQLHCPLLMLICEQDTVAPTRAAFKVAERGGDKVEVHRFPIGHFDIYQGAHYEQAQALMTDFLQRSLSG